MDCYNLSDAATLSSVMLGLDPSIHAASDVLPWDVDPRVKPEDDGGAWG